MILTPIDFDALPGLLARFERSLGDVEASIVFRRIAIPQNAHRAEGDQALAHHRCALALLSGLEMKLLPGPPSEGFSWDGREVRTGTEAYVLLHEAAHFQLASPTRRRKIDFGLGPGPETGSRDIAQRAASLFGLAREREEAKASLLGILWEVEFGQPALASLLDQNWLEGAGRSAAADHFSTILSELRADGFITRTGTPRKILRQTPDFERNNF